MNTALDFGIVALYVVFVWWASTGLIFVLNGLPERTYQWSLLAGTTAAISAVVAIYSTLGSATRFDAVTAFTAAIVVWGLIEMSFLMGYVTGPRRTPLPEASTPTQRFRFACEVIAYHEVALIAVLMALFVVSQGAKNSVAFSTFGILWLMRISTKFNIFLGVPNTAADLLPKRIGFIKSYFRQAPMNGLFPVSITLATVGTAWLAYKASASILPVDAVSFGSLATLSALGLIEHWFLLVPVPVERLWNLDSAASKRMQASVSEQPVKPGTVLEFRVRSRRQPIVTACDG